MSILWNTFLKIPVPNNLLCGTKSTKFGPERVLNQVFGLYSDLRRADLYVSDQSL